MLLHDIRHTIDDQNALDKHVLDTNLQDKNNMGHIRLTTHDKYNQNRLGRPNSYQHMLLSAQHIPGTWQQATAMSPC